MAQIKTRVTFVYGEAQVSERYKNWDMLRGIVGANDLPWVVMGDFNEVLRPDEHVGIGQRSNAQIQAFRDTMDVCSLMDIGFSGRPWTFNKKVRGGTYTRVRLDRALATTEWHTLFPMADLSHLTAATSDHCPILLNLNREERVARPPQTFRYEVMWEGHSDWGETIDTARLQKGVSTTVEQLKDKLHAISNDLGRWDRNTFGCVRKEIKDLKKELEKLQSDPNHTAPTHVELKINEKLVELYHREELMWRQRSRIQWLTSGDKNTIFFI